MDFQTDFLALSEYHELPVTQELAESEMLFSEDLGAIQNPKSIFGPLSVTRLHRHFELDGGELPVWRVTKNGFELRATKQSTTLIPVTWEPEGNGFKAVEYIDPESDKARAELVRRLTGFAKGLDESKLVSVLNDLSFHGRVGVTFLPNFFAGERDLGIKRVFIEYESDEGLKKTEVIGFPCDPPDAVGTLKTTWSPTEEGDWDIVCHCVCRNE